MGGSQPQCAVRDNMQWKYIYDRMVSLIPRIKSISVKWMKPAINWIKVNTDGISFNDGTTGSEGIVWDHETNIVMDFSQQLDNGTNNCSEAKATLFGVHLVLE